MNRNLATPEAPRDLDRLLGAFFRSRMPDPWPACPVGTAESPGNLRLRPAPTWWRSVSRLAVAAAIVLMVCGYLALARNFPAPSGSTFEPDRNLNIGDKPGRKKAEPILPQRISLPGGGEAWMLEQKLPRGYRISVQEISSPSKNR